MGDGYPIQQSETAGSRQAATGASQLHGGADGGDQWRGAIGERRAGGGLEPSMPDRENGLVDTLSFVLRAAWHSRWICLVILLLGTPPGCSRGRSDPTPTSRSASCWFARACASR